MFQVNEKVNKGNGQVFKPFGNIIAKVTDVADTARHTNTLRFFFDFSDIMLIHTVGQVGAVN
jgi:hypothetical protein